MQKRRNQPLFVTSDINSLADVLTGQVRSINANVLYSICLLSEALILNEKVILPSHLYGYFKNWSDRFCINVDEIFLDAAELLGGRDLTLEKKQESDFLTTQEFLEYGLSILKQGHSYYRIVNLLCNGGLSSDDYSSLSQEWNIDLLPDFNFSVQDSVKYSTNQRYGYSELLKKYNAAISNTEKITKANYLYIPPISNLVLDRAKDAEDIPRSIVFFREEFSELRALHEDMLNKINSASSIIEEIAYVEEYINSESVLGKKLEGTKSRSVVRFIWDFIKPFNMVKIGANAIDSASDSYKEYRSISKLHRYSDLYEEIGKSSPSIRNVHRLFGNFELSNDEIDKLKKIGGYN